MARIDKALWARGREIFERDRPENEVWGDNAARQTHTFPSRKNPEALTLTVIGEDKRARYLEMARQELAAEALFDASLTPKP